jgi:hypothetical protein
LLCLPLSSLMNFSNAWTLEMVVYQLHFSQVMILNFMLFHVGWWTKSSFFFLFFFYFFWHSFMPWTTMPLNIYLFIYLFIAHFTICLVHKVQCFFLWQFFAPWWPKKNCHCTLYKFIFYFILFLKKWPLSHHISRKFYLNSSYLDYQ